jgi:hypothetical protein
MRPLNARYSVAGQQRLYSGPRARLGIVAASIQAGSSLSQRTIGRSIPKRQSGDMVEVRETPHPRGSAVLGVAISWKQRVQL